MQIEIVQRSLCSLSAPPIGTVIDSSVFMRTDVAAAWRA